MNYQQSILRPAQKQLAALPSEVYQQVKKKTLLLSSNPRPTGCKKLIGRPAWRIRVGNYRVIYEINDQDKMILIVDVGHRKDIY